VRRGKGKGSVWRVKWKESERKGRQREENESRERKEGWRRIRRWEGK
jgi:hypothetical protein